MPTEIVQLAAVIIITIVSVSILITTDWRLSIIFMALIYTAEFLLVINTWTLQMAVVKLVAGWMTCAVIGMAAISSTRVRNYLEGTRNELDRISSTRWNVSVTEGRPFHLVAASLVIISMFFLAPKLESYLPDINVYATLGGLILIGMGLLKLGFTQETLLTILGLLMLLAGFEIIYAFMEDSALVAGLLAVITLGIGLAGAYLLITPFIEEIE